MTKEKTVAIHLSPFHPNIATFGRLSFRVHVPYNAKEVTIQTNPNLLEYHENADQPGIRARQVHGSGPSSQSRILKFETQNNKPQKIRIDDRDYEIQLLSIGTERIERQEFFIFSFLIRERFILPPKLYKYRAVNDTSLRILADDELYYAHYRSLNDPSELDFEVDVSYQPNSVKIRPEAIELAKQKIKANIQGCFHPNLGLLSLTASNNDFQMWSYYAEGHAGFCLEFDTSIFDSELLKEVTYSKEPYCIRCRVDDQEEGIIIPADNDEYLIGICNTKGTGWKHEKEWRVVCKQSGAKKFDPGGLTGLIFGVKTSTEKKQRLLAALKERRRRLGGQPTVRVFEARLQAGEYGIGVIDTDQRF